MTTGLPVINILLSVMNFDDEEEDWDFGPKDPEKKEAVAERPAVRDGLVPPIALRAVRTIRGGPIVSDNLKEVRDMATDIARRIALRPSYIQPRREPVDPSELDPGGMEHETYQTILGMLPPGPRADAHIYMIKDVIERGIPMAKHHISGRIINTAVTVYWKYSPTTYYLMRSEEDSSMMYVPAEERSKYDIRMLEIFCLRREYCAKTSQFHKGLFDPFARSREVWHTLTDGTKVPISLCKFHFYLWLIRYCVLDFIDDKYDEIMKVHTAILKKNVDKKRDRAVAETDDAKEDDTKKKRRRKRRRRKVELPDEMDAQDSKKSYAVAAKCPPLL